MAPKKAPSPTPDQAADEAPEEEVAAEQLQGDFIFPDGTIYKGWYLKKGENDVVLHGEGSLQSGPESFKGTFEQGFYKMGKYISCNGAVYQGSFRDNLFDGMGDYSWPDGRAYKGTWKNGKMHGRGQFQNFSAGGDKEFRGFSVAGKFCSDATAQEEAKRTFMAEYGTEYADSARQALKAISQQAEITKDNIIEVPGEAEWSTPEGKLARMALERVEETLLRGPFPAQDAVQLELLKKLVENFESAETPVEVVVVTEKAESVAVEPSRIRLEQLQHVGQLVELSQPAAEAPAIRKLVLLNVSAEYTCDKAEWKIVHCEETEAPA